MTAATAALQISDAQPQIHLVRDLLGLNHGIPAMRYPQQGRLRRVGLTQPASRRFQSTPNFRWSSGRQRNLPSCGTAPGPSSSSSSSVSLSSSLQNARGFFRWREGQERRGRGTSVVKPIILLIGGLLVYSLYPAHESRRIRLAEQAERLERQAAAEAAAAREKDGKQPETQTAWSSFTSQFQRLSSVTDIEWSALSGRIADIILPEWSKPIPGYLRKLQRELSTLPGSLSEEIWEEAHNAEINPEIRYSAKVRVSDQLCDEEKEFLARRKKVAAAALAKYLRIEEKEIDADDVPTIAMCGSGGGLRALVAGTGSLLAAQEDGLFDCFTYTAGVSGSCWLLALYHSSVAERRLDRLIDHMKARLGVHIADPSAAFASVLSAPTNKILLRSLVEKLRGDANASVGLVDIYGILLAARLLVPKGELGVNERDFKISNQRTYVKYGQNPMPIYTAVRHEIPDLTAVASNAAESRAAMEKQVAKRDAWFQWYEITPYEFFCEEFNAGIPTWAMGRRFNNGLDVAPESGFHVPELRMPILLGIFGSAFCATMSHYYREVRPILRNLLGLSAVDDVIHGYNEDLEKMHPFDPARLPNFVYGMKDDLRFTTPTNIPDQEYIQLMDAGMSNNLPIYPLMRPGRGIDIIVAFDASSDIKTDNWLSVADGYARQRGIKGWPVGAGWPRPEESAAQTEKELDSALAATTAEAEGKMEEARQGQHGQQALSGSEKKAKALHDQSHPEDSELGYCTVWVGSTQERSSEPPTASEALTDETSWQLLEPHAGLAVAYLPFMANRKVPDCDPVTSDFMSTWNFVYTPEQVDKVVALSRANFDEGKEQIRKCVRAVYERKKRLREEREEAVRRERRRRLRRLGIDGKLGEGDHFS